MIRSRASSALATFGLMLALCVAPEARGPLVMPLPDTARMALISNEVAFRDQAAAEGDSSAGWHVSSGSLFGGGAFLWSGKPDGNRPNFDSSLSTGSAVLRATTAQATFQDVTVSFDLHVNQFVQTPRTGFRSFDGVHLLLRYRSEMETYAVSVFRRDGKVALKKKVPGGVSNGGTYFTLAEGQMPSIVTGKNQWRQMQATISGHRSVRLSLRIDGHSVLTALDRGAGGIAPISYGAVGIRGDNCDFYLFGLDIRDESQNFS
ncbi:hypothetical protein COUCH_05655 [Couchioplanes caeruleus]|uniref:hypothetical protein n=1 Tax=Couchioplanes caeruleus TaxID=56438 RepID=UPI0020BF99BB|nr:hypothetical protein [Couchioplanes caeruleus]UQU65802.1 hypothetical protein COUCH_05655 [Couchioplanes caeruleus]